MQEMNQSACIQTYNTLTVLHISNYFSYFSLIQRTMASTMLGVRRNGTISGRASDNPLSKRQSKSQFMFSAFVVSIRTFSVCGDHPVLWCVRGLRGLPVLRIVISKWKVGWMNCHVVDVAHTYITHVPTI